MNMNDFAKEKRSNGIIKSTWKFGGNSEINRKLNFELTMHDKKRGGWSRS